MSVQLQWIRCSACSGIRVHDGWNTHNWHGRTIFIAECKFWDGPKELTKAIDQLFGYTTFRETKVALLVFNRKTKFTTVLKGIAKTVPTHKNYEKTVSTAETVWRYIFRHLGDDERKIALTVMAFDIPVDD